MNDIVSWLASDEFNRTSTIIGIYTATFFFTLFGCIMVLLFWWSRPPRDRLDLGWTWVITAVAAILWRTIHIILTHTDSDFWSTLVWWNLTFSILYTSVTFILQRLATLADQDAEEDEWTF